MNSISRAIHTRICLLSRRLLLLQSHFCTTAAKPQTPNTHTVTSLRFKSKPPQPPPPNPDLLPRPTQVPFQPKVANSVRLIGQVRTPLHVVRTPDGKVLAATVLASSSPSPANYLRKMLNSEFDHLGLFLLLVLCKIFEFFCWVLFSIPIVFEGDLAHTADLHLKDGDFVFVAGSLRSDLDHLNAGEDQGRLQVKPNSPDFNRKERGHALWLNKAPHSVLSELEGVEFDVQIQKSKQVNESKGGTELFCSQLEE